MEEKEAFEKRSIDQEEISLKEMIEKILEFWLELWNKKWWIIISAIPCMIYFGYTARQTVITYNAKLTYTLNEGNSGGGALSGILGSFGLGKGGKVNLDKIVELSKSRNIIQKVLFSTIALDTLQGKKDFIANHLISLYQLDKEWTNKHQDWTGFRFKSDQIDGFTKEEFAALKMLHKLFVGGTGIKSPIFSNGFNEDTGILTISANTVDEEFSIVISNKIYEELKKYYEFNTVKSGRKTFEFVESKKDSILSELKSKKLQLASFNDRYRKLVDPSMLVEKSMIETEIQKLTLAYGEASKNYEIANYSLESSTPDITIIDEPLPPLEPVGSSLFWALIKGGLLGGLVAASIIIGRKLILDALAN